MQKKMILLQIPDGSTINEDVIPRLTYCRSESNETDATCTVSVDIMDCNNDIIKKLESIGINYPTSSNEITRYSNRRCVKDKDIIKLVLA